MAEYIEREKTVKLLRSLGNREYRKEKGTIQDAIKMISYPEYTPTADVAPVVHGRDVYKWHKEGHCEFKCSVCGAWAGIIEGGTLDGVDFDYCPNCGAKMDGGDGDAAD